MRPPVSPTRRLAHRLSLLLLLTVAPLVAPGQGLSNFGFYVSQGATINGGTLQGTAAVGGSASLTNVTVGSMVSIGGTNLVVGGNLTANGGSVNGVTVVGGTVSASGGWTSTTLQPPGTPVPVNFASESLRLANLSAALAALPTNGSSATAGNILTLSGTGSGVFVFNINQSDIPGSLRITLPFGSTAIVNINGSAGSMRFLGMSLSGGIVESSVLYNFHNASTLELTGVGVLGSILAPGAAVDAGGGVVLGQGLFGSYNAPSDFSFNQLPFAGTLPVPEPGTWALLVAGGASAFAFGRRRRSSA